MTFHVNSAPNKNLLVAARVPDLYRSGDRQKCPFVFFCQFLKAGFTLFIDYQKNEGVNCKNDASF